MSASSPSTAATATATTSIPPSAMTPNENLLQPDTSATKKIEQSYQAVSTPSANNLESGSPANASVAAANPGNSNNPHASSSANQNASAVVVSNSSASTPQQQQQQASLLPEQHGSASQLEQQQQQYDPKLPQQQLANTSSNSNAAMYNYQANPVNVNYYHHQHAAYPTAMSTASTTTPSYYDQYPQQHSSQQQQQQAAMGLAHPQYTSYYATAANSLSQQSPAQQAQIPAQLQYYKNPLPYDYSRYGYVQGYPIYQTAPASTNAAGSMNNGIANPLIAAAASTMAPSNYIISHANGNGTTNNTVAANSNGSTSAASAASLMAAAVGLSNANSASANGAIRNGNNASSLGQVPPAGMRAVPHVATTMWEDEKTECYQVEANNVTVVRRADNNMINGTKLLNVAHMTRGRRDGILKLEKIRHVVKIGSMNLKGVWIPYDRALELAEKEDIVDVLYPLFVRDIKSFVANSGGANPGSSAVTTKQQQQAWMVDQQQQAQIHQLNNTANNTTGAVNNVAINNNNTAAVSAAAYYQYSPNVAPANSSAASNPAAHAYPNYYDYNSYYQQQAQIQQQQAHVPQDYANGQYFTQDQGNVTGRDELK